MLGARGIHVQSEDIHAVVGGTLRQLPAVLVPDAELLIVREARKYRDVMPARLEARDQLRHQDASRIDVGWELNDEKKNAHVERAGPGGALK